MTVRGDVVVPWCSERANGQIVAVNFRKIAPAGSGPFTNARKARGSTRASAAPHSSILINRQPGILSSVIRAVSFRMSHVRRIRCYPAFP